MKLSEFKGEEAFKVMGRTVGCLRAIFQDEKVLAITQAKEKGWILEFLEYSLCEQSNKWLDLYCILTPQAKRSEVSTQDVITFASDFTNDEQLMSLFFTQSRTMMPKTSIGSVTENTEV